MRKRIWRPLFLLTLFAVPAFALAAGPDVAVVPKPPAKKWTELKIPAGELVVLSAAPGSRWDVRDEKGLQLRSFEEGRSAAVLASTGRYRVEVTAGGETTYLLLVAGEAPPVPPDPPVPPPTPVDPLRAKIKAAYDADPADAAKRHEQAKDLAELYRQAADLAGKAEVATSGDLLARIKAASTTLVGADALKGVRGEVAKELAALLPADAALSDDQRKAVAELFKKLAQILDGIGG